MKLSDTSLDSLYVMLKGEPGTRKSTQALTFPKPQYWFSIDKKMKALIRPAKMWGIDMSQVDYDDYSAWLGKDSIFPKLESFLTGCKYKTLVLDSVTSMGDSVNIQTMKDKTKDQGDDARRVGGIRINTLEDYKAEASAFQSMIDVTKQIQVMYKVNIILIAHVVGERAQKEVNTTAHARIIITGGKTISGKIPAYCEEIYHFDLEAEAVQGRPAKNIIYTQYTDDDYARTSLPMPSKIEMTASKQLYPDYVEPAIKQLMASK
jgi:hypothetical protein